MTTRTHTLTITKQQLEFIRDATELLSRIAGGQIEEALRYAPIDQKDYWEARGAMLRALEPFISKTYQPSVIDSGCWDIYQVTRHRLAWDRKPQGVPFHVDFYEPMQCGPEPLPVVKRVEAQP